eukprot:UN25392
MHKPIVEKNTEKLRPLLERNVVEKNKFKPTNTSGKTIFAGAQKAAQSDQKPSLFKQMIQGKKEADDGLNEYDVFDPLAPRGLPLPFPENVPKARPRKPVSALERNFKGVGIKNYETTDSITNNLRKPRIFTCDRNALPKGPISVLFLDVDGVLNYGTQEGICDSKVKLLKEIWTKTDCYIVLSTAWRNGVFQRNMLVRTLERAGLNIKTRILGDTPQLETQGRFTDHVSNRANEIDSWVKRCNLKVQNWCAIDDMPLFLSRPSIM